MRSSFILLFFDLPAKTSQEKKEYRTLVNNLKKGGYRRIQKSIFAKHLRNSGSVKGEIQTIGATAPTGNVALLPISAKQFSEISCVGGEELPIGLFTDSVMVI